MAYDDQRECEPSIVEVVYTWPDGREEVRYQRPFGDKIEDEVRELQARHGAQCPYSLRYI